MVYLFHFFTFLLLLFYMPAAHAPRLNFAVTKMATPVHATKESDELIPWSDSRRLTWDDFLCAPQHNTDAVALTSTALGIAYRITNNQFTYQINCDFSKTKSWGLLKTPYILSHEQGHFDITEIFARKLNKALMDYKYNRKTFKQDINTIYDTIVKEKEFFQESYDEETNHSRNKKVQQQWLEKIQLMLDETAPYASYP